MPSPLNTHIRQVLHKALRLNYKVIDNGGNYNSHTWRLYLETFSGLNVPPVRINESENASPMAHASLHFNPFYTHYLYN